MWYVRDGEVDLGPYPDSQMRELIAQGILPPDTLVLRQGTQQWVRVRDTALMQAIAMAEEAPVREPFDFKPTGSKSSVSSNEPTREQLQNPFWTDFAGQPAPGAVPLAEQALQYDYRSPETLKSILLVLGVILAIMHGLMIASLFKKIDFYTKLEQGFYANNEAQGVADEEAFLEEHSLIALSQLVPTLLFGVVFLIWTYRTKANTWGLGARGMTITPGWSVGWFFVPIMNLVRPYQSMQETWKASLSPGNWLRQPGSTLVGFWWFFWITSSILGRISVYKLEEAKDAAKMLDSAQFDLVAEFYNYCPLLAITLMVFKITNMQTQLAAETNLAADNQYRR